MNANHLNFIKEINYLPVGLGKDSFSSEWFRDNTGINITEKNNYYGEYTFHYWLWQNKMEIFNEKDWIGFCAYRRFWLNEKEISNSEIFQLCESNHGNSNWNISTYLYNYPI